jgi:hypothetical protein
MDRMSANAVSKLAANAAEATGRELLMQVFMDSSL